MTDGLIATPDLRLADVPGSEAEREVLEQFCLTIDGYENGRVSIGELMELAERLERIGWANATLDELRLAAFIRQRELRANDCGYDEINGPMVDRIRRIVREIRSRLTD